MAGSLTAPAPSAGPVRRPSRRELLALIDDEIEQTRTTYEATPAGERGRAGWDELGWYLNLSRQWAVQHLRELSRRPAGAVLDIGAGYGLIAGVAQRLGWRVAAVDATPLPAFCPIRRPDRGVELGVYNACTDSLPFPDDSFDVILLCEVLEHLTYSPMPMFREIRRTLRPGGVLLLSTPNPAALKKLVRLACGGLSPHEPYLWMVTPENNTYTHKGLTFFENHRESKLWTGGDIRHVLGLAGMTAVDCYYFGNTITPPGATVGRRLSTALMRHVQPFVRRLPVSGGSVFVVAAKPAA